MGRKDAKHPGTHLRTGVKKGMSGKNQPWVVVGSCSAAALPR